jgi:hypothetical protein
MDESTSKQIEDWTRNINILHEELENSPSCRSCVIVAAAYLDIVLRDLLSFFLSAPHNKDEDKELFSGFGPLSSFNSRILISSRLGLISDYEYRALRVVRKIRNSFAHNLSVDSLDNHKSILLTVIPPKELIPVKSIPLASSYDEVPPLPIISGIDLTSARDIFVKVVMCLSNLLSARCLFIKKQKREVPEDFKSIIDIDNQKIGELQTSLEEVERLIKLELKAIELNREKLELLRQNGKGATAEIKECQEEINRLENDLERDYEAFKMIDTFISVSIFARDQIKKAFEEQV